MSEIESAFEKELAGEVKKNIPLREYISLGVGGVADYFYEAKDIDSLAKAIILSYDLKIPYFLLGGGNNVVPSDSGFPGIVIKNAAQNVVFSDDNSQAIADSGVGINKMINLAASRDLGGLEFLVGVPGTIGGAVYGNAGAFNYEIGDFVKSAVLLMPKENKMVVVKKDKDWFEFAYRSSKLKREFGQAEHKPILLTIKLQLVKRRKDEILNLMRQNSSAKRQSQPVTEKSCGSFFKNPIDQRPAGYLLEQAGVKKLKSGGALFSKSHANYLINRKNATASDVRKLAEEAKGRVKEKFGVDLEEEIEYVGRW